MTNPITAARQKIEENKVPLAFAAGVVTTTVVTFIITKKLPTKALNPMVQVPQTMNEIIAMFEEHGAIEIVTPGSVITLLPSDYKYTV